MCNYILLRPFRKNWKYYSYMYVLIKRACFVHTYTHTHRLTTQKNTRSVRLRAYTMLSYFFHEGSYTKTRPVHAAAARAVADDVRATRYDGAATSVLNSSRCPFR